MDDLVTWLREQIAEDEEAARKRMHHAQENHLLLQDPKYLGLFVPGWHEWPEIEAAAAHALAQCEAHTAILDRYERADKENHAPDAYSLADDLLRALALAYQHRPGYQDMWRP